MILVCFILIFCWLSHIMLVIKSHYNMEVVFVKKRYIRLDKVFRFNNIHP